MTNPEIRAKEVMNKSPKKQDMTLLRREEIDAKLKKMGLESPTYGRNVMDDLSGISIVFWSRHLYNQINNLKRRKKWISITKKIQAVL